VLVLEQFPLSVTLRLAVPNDFEDDDGGLTPGGNWQWGIPNYEEGPEAHSGERCWGTNLSGNYSTNQDHRLTTPDYDLSGYDEPRLAFWHWYEIWGPYDGINVTISTDGGSNWEVIEPIGRYPDSCVDGIPGNPCQPGWNAYSDAWVPAAFDLTDYQNEAVRFRFTLGTWGYTNAAGWYIDDLQVYDRNPADAAAPEPALKLFLGAPVPSPSQGAVTLSFGLDHSDWVDARVYDASGRQVRQLLQRTLPAGIDRLQWDGRNDRGLPTGPGIYFVRVRIGHAESEGAVKLSRKIVRIR
jgi:hypothetical protein